MTSDQIRGNEGVVKALFGMVDAGKVPNAILLQDEDGGQAMEICLAFVRYLYCHSHVNGSFCGECPQCNKTGKLIHPDVHFIFPTASSMLSAQFSRQFRELALSNPRFTEDELSAALGIEGKKQMIGVDEAKYLLDELSVSSLEGGFRTVVVFLPEYMNAEAANRLLKSVEETDSKTVFVMITHHPEKVLQTISSRCQRIMVAGSGCGAPVSFQSPEVYSMLLDALCSRDFFAALDVADSLAGLPSRDIAKSFCKFAAFSIREIFLVQQGLPSDSTSEIARRSASSLPKSFPRNALSVFDDAARKIDLNINLKILFTDMVDKLMIYAK